MPDYLVTDLATGQRIKMSGPAPPSEALIRLALAQVKPLPSHVQQTADPLQAMQKAQTIGPARVGERYQEDLNPSLVGIARKVLGGAQRPASVAAEDPYGIGAWLKGAGPMPTPIAAEIQAYHGSPHDFEKFLLEKIGTGEGAQAYGHGLYFAENPAVAEEYKKQLTRDVGRWVDPTGVGSSEDAVRRKVADAAYVAGSSKPVANSMAVDLIQRTLRGDDLAKYATNDAEKAAVDTISKYNVLRPKGATYHVSIKADPDQFLDWDKPLSQQPPKVQEGVTKALKAIKLPEDFETGLPTWLQRDPDGQSIHAALSSAGGSNREGQAIGSARLKEAGIPGIKYLDQGSRTTVPLIDDMPLNRYAPKNATEARAIDALNRNTSADEAIAYLQQESDLKMSGAPEARQAQAWLKENAHRIQQPKGTSNYVVFDDKLIDILKKYAVAGAVGGSLASLGQPQTEEQK